MQPNPVTVQPGDDVQVYMHDFLAGSLAIGEEEVDALAFRYNCPQRIRNYPSYPEHAFTIGRIEVCQAAGRGAGNDQAVTRIHRRNIHDDRDTVVLVYDFAR